MAQWRLLCELGEDPVPPREGGERGPGRARVDPATLADRFAEERIEKIGQIKKGFFGGI